jgi:DNA-binding NarL/FixJ family response regulator
MSTGAQARAWINLSAHTPITVVLARFDDLFARGLRELIESDPNLVVVAAEVEHARIPVVLRAHRPDVAILDMGALVKLAEVRELRAGHLGTRLVLLGNDPSIEECVQLLAFGASAALGRNTQSRDVLNAIHLASRGLQLMPSAGAEDGGSIAGPSLMTPREAEVLPLLQQGRSNAQIALALHVGVETVRTHARNIYRKLGVSSRRELAAPSGSPASQAAPVPSRAEQPESPAPRSARRRATTRMARQRRGPSLRHR